MSYSAFLHSFERVRPCQGMEALVCKDINKSTADRRC